MCQKKNGRSQDTQPTHDRQCAPISSKRSKRRQYDGDIPAERQRSRCRLDEQGCCQNTGSSAEQGGHGLLPAPAHDPADQHIGYRRQHCGAQEGWHAVQRQAPKHGHQDGNGHSRQPQAGSRAPVTPLAKPQKCPKHN